MLLTGGASQRMGRDKSGLIIGGVTLAERTAQLLLGVVEMAIEVGPGVSGLAWTREDPSGEGPLVAIAEGRRALRERGHEGAALVVACDLPLLSARLLTLLCDWEAPGSVVPIVRGMPQPLCAKWGPGDLDRASALVNSGVRSLRHLMSEPDVVVLDESNWGDRVEEEEFSDVDSPDDARRLGLDI
jgi:molybdopterin-guanine dinucleotide biosynthesis protein A